MKLKQIVIAILRILWMLAPPTRVEGCFLRGARAKLGVKGLKGLKGMKVQREDKLGQATPQTPQTLQTPQTPQANSKSECAPTVDAPAAVTFGSSCSRVLPRSQVLSLLRSDCLRSTRKISLLVLHCTDTRPDQDFTIEKLMASHRARGFGTCPGYHLYVRRDGSLYYCRPISERGCHVKGYNAISLGICYEGGHSCSPEYKHEDNRTAEQMVVLDEIFTLLHEVYPDARIVGHCELNPCKACPCLNPPASKEYKYIFNA